MYKIIEELKKRSNNPSDDVKIELKLYNLADDLEKKARNHLKRITGILSEFDIHDEAHSEKVICNIEKLIGQEKIPKLSSYELFLLHLSSFLHDCAMAPSDWEIKVLKLTEGTANYTEINESLANDLKTPYNFSKAKEIIKQRKDSIYQNFDEKVKDWLFSPSTEQALIYYLAKMMINYQNYRNGYSEQIREICSQEDFVELNNFIRRDYIRATHHLRIEPYVKNLSSYFEHTFEQPSWGKQLANDLALSCRSHGENISYLKKFSQSVQYYGDESTNLQMVGMFLRLGDIVHFSFDRAPNVLRHSRIFKSEYSALQWKIKNSGVNYSIEEGEISFRAYCEKPDTYFKLHEYLDWIEIEIQNYFKLERSWSESYMPNLNEKIDRSNINNNEKIFFPKRGLNFTLNQEKIIDLLMGVGLYKDKFACLRELYQNSLDACRCMLAKNRSIEHQTKGKIQFSIENSGDKTYLCCIDNGIGMAEHVIEQYLLKIGKSYYKSSEFFKNQAQWGGSFTPTSQFGIGILSCFMIGSKVEIITKTKDGEYIACSIDGPHENFYYKTATELEKEQIVESGTIVKVLLSDDSKEMLSNKDLEKLHLLMLGKPLHFPDEFTHYEKYYKDWEKHIYNKINSFVKIVPKNIELEIKTKNGDKLPIFSNPILFGTNDKLSIPDVDQEFVNHIIDSRKIFSKKSKFTQIKDSLETYKIDVVNDTIQYKTFLTLPNLDIIDDDYDIFHNYPPVNYKGACIEGVSVRSSTTTKYYYSNSLLKDGILNFIGDDKPQLAVDRTSLVNYPEKFEKAAKDIAEKLLKKVISKTREHIHRNRFKEGNTNYELLWKFVFDKIGFADRIFIEELGQTDYGDILWPNIENAIDEKVSIKTVLEREQLSFKNYNFSKYDKLTERLILYKLFAANKIEVVDDKIECVTYHSSNGNGAYLVSRRYIIDYKRLVKADSWQGRYFQYDIVSDLYPIVPQRVFDLISDRSVENSTTDRMKMIRAYSNGITAFFDQDPILINKSMGLYSVDSHGPARVRNNNIYNFERKRTFFQLNSINHEFIFGDSNECVVISVFINPRELNKSEQQAIEKYKEEDPTYYLGVKEGWSILVTSRKKYDNLVILPGVRSRSELISELSNEFWDENEDVRFKFPDGSSMNKLHGE